MTAICRVSLAGKKNSLPPLEEEGNRERRREEGFVESNERSIASAGKQTGEPDSS